MLPFLQPKKLTSVIVARRGKPAVEAKAEEVKESHPLTPAAEDLLRAIDERSIDGIAKALHAAFEIADSQPHQEGPHEEST